MNGRSKGTRWFLSLILAKNAEILAKTRFLIGPGGQKPDFF
jgi:hypothetical protein